MARSFRLHYRHITAAFSLETGLSQQSNGPPLNRNDEGSHEDHCDLLGCNQLADCHEGAMPCINEAARDV